MQQPRPQELEGITEMYPEIEIIGITIPTCSDDFDYGVDDLIADATRTAYQTNDKATPHSNQMLLKHCAAGGHTSIFEHASVTIRIRGASRAFTHQVVRHRHQGITQESQRYCDEGNFGFSCPPAIKEAGLEDQFYGMMESARQNYLYLQKKLKEAGLSSHRANEDARFVLPNAVQSEIVISPNFAELRHMFRLRLTTHAQWEIFNVFKLILEEIVHYTHVFDDIKVYFDDHGNLDCFGGSC
jgi:thymidylate synthase (FAD)